MKEQTHIKCLQQSCPDRERCGIANNQIEGKRTIYIGYKDGSCNEYKPIKKEEKK